MTTAHNEHTGASMTTAGKGSLEKYARGWDAIFGPRKADKVWHMENGSSITFKDTGAELLVGLSSTVMALDFHDSQPDDNFNPYAPAPGVLEYFDACKNLFSQEEVDNFMEQVKKIKADWGKTDAA